MIWNIRMTTRYILDVRAKERRSCSTGTLQKFLADVREKECGRSNVLSAEDIADIPFAIHEST